MFGKNVRASVTDKALTEGYFNKIAIETIVHEDKQRLQFTPDYLQLSQKKSHLLFIHDDMAQLQPNHVMVQAGVSGFYPLGYGYTSKKYSFITKNLGQKSFPIALDLRDTEELPLFMAEKHRIRGEIYAIRAPTFIDLDTHRQNGVQFNRVRVNINIGYRKLYRHHWFNASGHKLYDTSLGKEEMMTQEMFMYVAREEYWKDQLNAGFFDFKPVTLIEEDRLWLKEYYQYSRVR